MQSTEIDGMCVRRSELRVVIQLLNVAIDRQKYSLGRSQAIQARNKLIRLVEFDIPTDMECANLYPDFGGADDAASH